MVRQGYLSGGRSVKYPLVPSTPAGPDFSLPARPSLDDLARALVRGGVAPDASVGWAARVGEGWRVEVASAGGEPDPIFDLASLTKPMTAVALARSSLSREALLGDVLGEARGAEGASTPLELLLAHRAGLEAHRRLYEPLVDARPFDRASALAQAAAARRADAEGPLLPGGFAPLYSDLGYILVGEALARAERAEDAGEVIEALVARALGREDLGSARALSRRGIDFARRVRPTEVVPWRGGEVRGIVHDENAWALTGLGGSGHAGMFGTARAVLAFGCAALDALERGDGPLAGGDLQWLVRPRAGGALRAGFDGKSGPLPSAGQKAGPSTVGHLGFTGTSFWIDPDAGLVTVVLTNRVHPTRQNQAIRSARPAVHDALFALADAARAGAL